MTLKWIFQIAALAVLLLVSQGRALRTERRVERLEEDAARARVALADARRDVAWLLLWNATIIETVERTGAVVRADFGEEEVREMLGEGYSIEELDSLLRADTTIVRKTVGGLR